MRIRKGIYTAISVIMFDAMLMSIFEQSGTLINFFLAFSPGIWAGIAVGEEQ